MNARHAPRSGQLPLHVVRPLRRRDEPVVVDVEQHHQHEHDSGQLPGERPLEAAGKPALSGSTEPEVTDTAPRVVEHGPELAAGAPALPEEAPAEQAQPRIQGERERGVLRQGHGQVEHKLAKHGEQEQYDRRPPTEPAGPRQRGLTTEEPAAQRRRVRDAREEEERVHRLRPVTDDRHRQRHRDPDQQPEHRRNDVLRHVLRPDETAPAQERQPYDGQPAEPGRCRAQLRAVLDRLLACTGIADPPWQDEQERHDDHDRAADDEDPQRDGQVEPRAEGVRQDHHAALTPR